jgi:hypothetical protein
MHDTAEQLEVVEDRLHHIADEAPDPGTRVRLHTLGDQVTAQAKDIEKRADRLRDDY